MRKQKERSFFPFLVGDVDRESDEIISKVDDNSSSSDYLIRRKSFFASNIIEMLSTEVPTETLKMANKILKHHTSNIEPIRDQSVKEFVEELIRYLGWDFSNVDCSETVEHFVAKSMEVLRDNLKAENTVTDKEDNKLPRVEHSNSERGESSIDLLKWLTSIRLEKYYQHLVDCGIDDMNFLLSYKDEVTEKIDQESMKTELDLTKVMKVGHVRLFTKKLDEYVKNCK